ncbi:MAG: phage holin family protein [Synechococcaceae cyanobacterium SM2_3_1]|nr:phage holin family protein [Synechococcaceae cyanobacterium SM2_3_1]
MTNLLAQWLLVAFSVIVTDWVLPGITLSGFGGALIAAITIGLVNTLVKPFLQLITLPISFLTLGLFLLVVNAICLSLAAFLAGDAITIDGFGWAFLGAIVLSLVSALIQSVFKGDSED